MLKLTETHIENLAEYLLGFFDDGVNLEELNTDHIATMIKMYIEDQSQRYNKCNEVGCSFCDPE